MIKLYRVRHPAAPDLFVWMAGDYNPESAAYFRPLNRWPAPIGEVATLTIKFSSTHPGMSEEAARELAAFVGGTVEEVPE